MDIYEQDVVMFETKENGDKVIKMPISRANNIEGVGRSASTAYGVGDVVYVDNNKKVALKCTTAGTTSANELNISTNNIGDTVTDGSVVWQVCNRTSDVTSVNGKTGDVVVDLPVGHMYWSIEPNVPVGRLPASGALYNRPLYQGLYNWADERGLVISESEWQSIASANDGNCAYYSDGDGSTTFRVPKLPTTIASDVPSEVPVVGNGMTLGLTYNNSSSYGLVSGPSEYLAGEKSAYGKNQGFNYTGSDWLPGGESVGLTSDASKSGIVAKTSATKITGQWLIVAFGVAHNVGEADVANVMQAVEQVQTGLGVVDGIADYIVESGGSATKWYRLWKSGWLQQGGEQTFARYDDGGTTVTFLKPFINKPTVSIGMDNNDAVANATNGTTLKIKTRTTTGLTAGGREYGGSTSVLGMWKAEGYAK